METGGFDGIIVRTRAGKRFVDAPEVRRISGGAVTEADRDEVIECLKRAYVRDELTTDQLGDRVSIAHLAESLSEL